MTPPVHCQGSLASKQLNKAKHGEKQSDPIFHSIAFPSMWLLVAT